MRSSARTQRREWFQQTGRRPTTPSRLSPRPNSIKSAVVEDSSANILTESTAVLSRWTDYCSGLYNYELHPDTSLLQSNQTPHKRREAYLC